MRSKYLPGILLLLLFMLAGCALPFAPQPTLARDGGYRIVLSAACPTDAPNCSISQRLSPTMSILQQRIASALSLSAAVVKQSGADQITVELPKLTSDTQARPLLTKRGQLNFIDTGTQFLSVGASVSGQTCTTACNASQYQIVFTGAQLDPNSISATLDPQSGQPVVSFSFAGSAKSAFAAYTRSHIAEPLTITLDDTVIESATIQSEIDGPGQIVGISSIAAAQSIASYLKYRPLPLALSVASAEYVSPQS